MRWLEGNFKDVESIANAAASKLELSECWVFRAAALLHGSGRNEASRASNSLQRSLPYRIEFDDMQPDDILSNLTETLPSYSVWAMICLKKGRFDDCFKSCEKAMHICSLSKTYISILDFPSLFNLVVVGL